MLAIILAISLFSVSSDTIAIKSTQNISYRVFTNDSNLYFQCKTNKNWAVPITIDKGNISEYAMTATSGDYIHIVWCKDGRVHYKTNQMPITRQDTIRWECNIAITPNFTEPASNLAVYSKDDYIIVNWQTPLEGNCNQVEKWRRARWLGNTPFEWEEPQNISPNEINVIDNPHSLTNRDPIIIKRVCFLQTGQYTQSDGKTLCYDCNHNGLNELIFRTGNRLEPNNPIRWTVLEYRPYNQYVVVFADTAAPAPYPPGITTGNFHPYDVGDIDNDSLTDLVGRNLDIIPDTEYAIVATQESPNYFYFPESLSWSYRYAYNIAASQACYFTNDLDNDGRNEIISATPTTQISTGIWENVANNQNVLVWHQSIGAFSFAFGDFDQDSLKEFATADLGSLGKVSVCENTGPDQYVITYQDTLHLPNGSDVFSGNDCDSDSLPEFFVGFLVVPTSTWYLYMWEATGNNTYQRTLVDQRTDGGGYYSSKCGDIDGDGIDEIVWAIGARVLVYKAIGNNQFQPVWVWNNDHGGHCTIVNIYDMNRNGYNEIVVGGAGKTSIFEVEAVRILSPNGGETFHPDSQELIQWQTFHPPRCDSMSLFYSIDNCRTYQSIIHGLQSTDTSYLWTVPNVNSDSCKIKIIAYGPGWQYDESDGIFSIMSSGITEIALLPLAMTLGIKVYPNPAKALSMIRYSLPNEGKITLQLYDISGRTIKTLVDENKYAGNYSVTLNSQTLPAGVYFLSLQTESKRIIERMVVIK